jgi:hypothetical protein
MEACDDGQEVANETPTKKRKEGRKKERKKKKRAACDDANNNQGAANKDTPLFLVDKSNFTFVSYGIGILPQLQVASY